MLSIIYLSHYLLTHINSILRLNIMPKYSTTQMNFHWIQGNFLSVNNDYTSDYFPFQKSYAPRIFRYYSPKLQLTWWIVENCLLVSCVAESSFLLSLWPPSSSEAAIFLPQAAAGGRSHWSGHNPNTDTQHLQTTSTNHLFSYTSSHSIVLFIFGNKFTNPKAFNSWEYKNSTEEQCGRDYNGGETL